MRCIALLRDAGVKAKAIMEEIRATAANLEALESGSKGAAQAPKSRFAADLRKLNDEQKNQVEEALRDEENLPKSSSSWSQAHPLPRTLSHAMCLGPLLGNVLFLKNLIKFLVKPFTSI